MNTSHELQVDEPDNDATPQLLRLAGARRDVSLARTERVRAAVHLEWQTSVQQRVRRRRIVMSTVALSAAAAVILFVGRFDLLPRGEVPPGDVVATVEGAEGSALRPGRVVRVGEWIETGGDSRVALRFGHRSVRLDAHTRVRPVSGDAVELAAGAVYTDSAGGSGGFEVRTPAATARDIGTQFEVRLIERGVRVRVRSGVVELRDGTQSVSVSAATEIELTGGRAVRRAVSPHGPEWDWTARLAPPMNMDRMSLDAFLRQLAREHGWSLRYVDAALAREATIIVLHGSVAGLSAHDAVDVAVTTSGLWHQLHDGELVVFRKGRPAVD